MSQFTNIFHSHLKDYPQTPDQFSQYKLEFLHSHEPSFKELGDMFCTKDEEKSEKQSFENAVSVIDQQDEDLFQLEVEIKLRRYTSFENGFMQNHRKVLKNSLEQFLNKINNIELKEKSNQFSADITSDIKSILFNEHLFSVEQISENRERFRKKVDQFKILKEMFQNFEKLQKLISKDAVLLGLWIIKHTDHVVQGILHENTFCINEVKMLKDQLFEYLNNNYHIDFLKPKVAQENSNHKQYNIMIESWLYTLLIAKLGYFDNDCFDVEVSLQEHLKALLREEKRQHRVFSDSEQEDEQIMSLELLTKKRKV